MALIPTVLLPPKALAVELETLGVLAVAVPNLLLSMKLGCFFEGEFLDFLFALGPAGRRVPSVLSRAPLEHIDFPEGERLSMPAVEEFLREVVLVEDLGSAGVLDERVEEYLILVIN